MAGLITVILALVAVAVLPFIDGRRVAGEPVATVFPPPPQVGDCVLPPFPANVRTGGPPVEIPVTDLRFGSCVDSIVGEILLPSNEGALSSTPLVTTAATRPCLGAAAGYAGLLVFEQSATLAGGVAGDPVEWMPTVGASTYLVGPGAQERAAGADWMACLSTPINNRAYLGSFRAAYTTGNLPDEFGLCWDGTDLDEMPTLLRCDEPHAAELLATGWVPDRSVVPPSEIEASCVGIAGRVMRTDDPTRLGAIAIVVDQVRLDGPSNPGSPLAVNCFATADTTSTTTAGTTTSGTTTSGRQLTRTVIGLADAPVPLSG